MARGRQRACDRRGFRLSCWCVFARTFISRCGIALGPLKSLRRVGEEVARRLLVGCLLAASKMLRNYPSVTLTRISSPLGWGMGIGKWEMGIEPKWLRTDCSINGLTDDANRFSRPIGSIIAASTQFPRNHLANSRQMPRHCPSGNQKNLANIIPSNLQ